MQCTSYIKDLINHIVFVIDRSGSMGDLADTVIEVFERQVAYLSTRSQELDQETRVSIYTFSTDVECVVYDKDVMRLPSLAGSYRVGGCTALLDGTAKAMDDLQHTSQLYGDHAFLIYVITDGYDNSSKTTSRQMRDRLASMNANWTLAVLVPSQQGVFECKKFGFATNNIQIWDTSKAGIEEAGSNIQTATEAFLTNRSNGVRGTTDLFQLDTTTLDTATVESALDELDPNTYTIYDVAGDSQLKPFVQQATGSAFVPGSAYYQLTKREKVHSSKGVIVRNIASGKVYGGENSRNLLNLPTNDVFVKPSQHSDFHIFIQSKSVNRKLIDGTSVLVCGTGW